MLYSDTLSKWSQSLSSFPLFFFGGETVSRDTTTAGFWVSEVGLNTRITRHQLRRYIIVFVLVEDCLQRALLLRRQVVRIQPKQTSKGAGRVAFQFRYYVWVIVCKTISLS